MTAGKSRTFETSIEIDAPVERVWRALTEADELVRWFPLHARVKPGAGGSIWISWGGSFEGEMRIEIWEPNRRLRAVPVQPTPADSEGREIPPSNTPPVEIVLDYYLEGSGGCTVLRLVHSGFGSGAEWDDEFESISKGWKFELRGLRHYLQRHAGEDRRVAWARCRTALPVDEAWARLAGPEGLAQEGRLEGLQEGDRYSIRAATGDAFAGVVQQCTPPRDFSGTVERMNDGLLRVATERFTGKTALNVWLSTYGVDEAIMEGFQARAQKLLDRIAAQA